MIELRNFATSGFDRAIIAMRRAHGGREASDSAWATRWAPDWNRDGSAYEFVIGERDIEECKRSIKAGNTDFLKYVVLWAHVEAPVQWWSVYGGYFIVQSNVARNGDMLTRSVMTTYANMHNLIETLEETAEGLETKNKLLHAVASLPECWMISPDAEERGR